MTHHIAPEVVAGVPRLPTQDELPYEDDIPMETARHRSQMNVLIETLQHYWATQGIQGFVGGNMFIYYSLAQIRTQDVRGPDFFAVRDVPGHERKSWVVWDEGTGPDIVIELISESTAAFDKGDKLRIYQNDLCVPEYIWYDPLTSDWAGFGLQQGKYVPLPIDNQGRLICPRLGLALVRWWGTYQDIPARWLRWATLDGTMVLTGEERAVIERRRAAAAEQQARAAERQAERERQQARAAEQRAAAAERQAERERQHARAAERQAERERQQAREAEQREERERQKAIEAEQQAEHERQQAEAARQRIAELERRLAESERDAIDGA